MMMYKLYKTDPSLNQPNAVMTVNVEPAKSFLLDPANMDYQEYLRWCEAGNTPEPADQPE